MDAGQLLGQQLWYGLQNGMAYVLFAVGLAMIFGVMRIANLAHGEFFMLGSMLVVSFTSVLGLPYPVGVVIAVVCVILVGTLIGRGVVQPLLKVDPMSTLLSTIAVSYILQQVAVLGWGTFARTTKTGLIDVYNVGGVRMSQNSLMIIGVGAAAVAFIYWFVVKTNKGKVVRATAQSMLGASLGGVNIKRAYDLTFMLGAGMAALGGALIGVLYSSYPAMGGAILMKGFAVVIIGGMGNIKGCIIVGLAIGLIEALFGLYVSAYYRETFIFGLMIAALLVRPEGLFARR
jgi:branched-chain amino acid transport system permease protein